jgi:UDP-4-amino-4,6-dideoxy-N-acetyl-beta-L-altrosamine transaminase
MNNIPYSRQDIDNDDISAVIKVLKSDFLTTGPVIEEFEESVKSFCSVKHAVAVSNGTAALHLALLSLGVGKGDIVWTCPISFVASANCALYVGADIDFVDCDPLTGNMDINLLIKKLEKAKLLGKLPKVIIAVHFSGMACDIKMIAKLAQLYDFKIVEDAAHALGAAYEDGAKVGSGIYSDFTTLSFHPVKSITTGEGGMLVTENMELADKARLLRTHGISRDNNKMHNDSHGPWYYEQLDLGFNYRITDIQSALGVSQMKRLPLFINRRQQIVARYSNELKNLPLILPKMSNDSAWHLYVIQLSNLAKISRADLFNKLRQSGVGVNVHYIPIHTQPFYKNIGFKEGDFPNSELFYSRAISLPVFQSMEDAQQDYVIEKLQEFLRG